MGRLKEIQQEVGDWSLSNFGQQDSKWMPGLRLGALAPLLGIGEELGELESSIIIENEMDQKDAIADIGVYLCDYCCRDNTKLPDVEFFPTQVADFVPDTTDAVMALGKLCHCTLKRHQGIRGMDNLEKYYAARDQAVYDLLEWLILFSESKGFKFIDVLDETWGRVKQRNWKKNPTSGGEHAGTEPPKE